MSKLDRCHVSWLAAGQARRLKTGRVPVRLRSGQRIDPSGGPRQSEAALRQSEQRYRQMFETNRSVKLIINPATGRIEDANPAACSFYGYSRPALLALRISDINTLPPEEIEREMAEAQAENRLYFNFRHRLANGEIRDVEVYSGPISTDEGALLYSIVHDVTARRKSEAELRKFRLFSEYASDAHILLDMTTRIRYANRRACERLGYSESEILQLCIPDIDPNYDTAMVQAHFRKCIEGRTPPFETVHRTKDGTEFPVEISSTALNLEGEWFAFTACRDITERKNAAAQFKFLAHYDALTRLPNRVLLSDRMAIAFAQARRSGQRVAVCYLDLDGFKAINDELGHDAGDDVLVEVAQRLQRSVRAGDTVARLGGDEFVLLLAGLEDEQACTALLSRVLAAVAAPLDLGGHLRRVSASLGFTLFPDDDGEPDVLLRHADQAMYRAKQAGKNRFHRFDDAPGRHGLTRAPDAAAQDAQHAHDPAMPSA
jgi:diguanylate cyclase (GGDEF)-like protein/PAS domain S-box-containing protein